MLASPRDPAGRNRQSLGSFHERQGEEFRLRAEIQRPIDILRSATSVNAAILQMQGKLGCIAAEAYADLILVAGNPLSDVSLLAERRNLKLIMRNGELIMNCT